MWKKMSYRSVQGGNYSWTVELGEERNKNSFRVYNQSDAEVVLETHEVWDSDVFKIVRILDKELYGRKTAEELLKTISRVCRHLDLEIYKYGGSILVIDSTNL